MTAKAVELVARGWPGTVTAIFPDLAAGGTVAEIWVPESTVKGAVNPPKVTLLAPVNPEPPMVTDVPTLPDVGENDPDFFQTGGAIDDVVDDDDRRAGYCSRGK